MNYLLDTHTLIWFLSGDDRLSKSSRQIIENQGHFKFISVATIWELAIKISLDKFKFEKGFKNFLELIDDNGFEIIPITFDHVLWVSNLEFIHRDPFDRLIVAQAMADNLIVITRDQSIEKYNIETFW